MMGSSLASATLPETRAPPPRRARRPQTSLCVSAAHMMKATTGQVGPAPPHPAPRRLGEVPCHCTNLERTISLRSIQTQGRAPMQTEVMVEWATGARQGSGCFGRKASQHDSVLHHNCRPMSANHHHDMCSRNSVSTRDSITCHHNGGR